MYVERHVVSVITDGSGNATVYTPAVTGRLSAIHYVKTDFTDGVDFTITAEATGEVLWQEANVNVSKSVAPRQPTHSSAGAAALFAAGGTAVLETIALAKDRIKVVIAQGGAGKAGTFHIVIE